MAEANKWKHKSKEWQHVRHFQGLPSTSESAVDRIWKELDFSAIDKQDEQIMYLLQKKHVSRYNVEE